MYHPKSRSVTDDHIPAGAQSLWSLRRAGPPDAAASALSPGIRSLQSAPLSPQRQLLDRRPTRPGDARRSPARRRSSGGTSRAGRPTTCNFTSTGTPGRTRDRPSCARPRSPHRSIGQPRTSRGWRSPRSSCCRRLPSSGCRSSASISHRREALHRAGRRQSRRRDRDGGAAARAGAARRDADDRADMDAHGAADLRAHRRHRKLLFHRAVVSEARRLEEDRVELPPVPPEHRVLFRLRRLRRAAHRAARLAGRRHRCRARAPRTTPTARRPTATTRRTFTTSHGRRAPTTSERTARFEHPTLPPVDDAAAAPAGARATRRSVTSTRRGTALKYYGEWFGAYPYGHLTIVDPAYQSDADGMEYPTLIHRGHRWLLPREVTQRPEEVIDPRSRAPVLVRHRRQQRVRGRLAGRGDSIPSPPRARSNRTIRRTSDGGIFGGFVPLGVPGVWLRRETFWNRLPGYRARREERRPR